VQYENELSHPARSNLGLPFVATNSITSATSILGPAPQRFYRIVLLR
jgi:hypothetical protein